MNRFKSHFVFNKKEQSEILLLVLLITGLLLFNYFVDFKKDALIDTTSAQIQEIQKELNEALLVKADERNPKIYPFNPNFITDYKAYTLGLSPIEFDRLKKYRLEDKWINSTSDFKLVTKVSDSLLETISPLFKFPEWVTNPKPRKSNFKNFNTPKTYAQKIDLNLATQEQLQQVSGIGITFSKRIIDYRAKLGGFSDDLQLYGVYGLEENVIKKTLNLFVVKTPKQLYKISINSASASDIATIPGVSFNLAKTIWEFVRLRDGITELSELQKIEDISPGKLQLIQLYLTLE